MAPESERSTEVEHGTIQGHHNTPMLENPGGGGTKIKKGLRTQTVIHHNLTKGAI